MRLGVRVRVRVVTVFPHHGQMGGLLMEGEGRTPSHLRFISACRALYVRHFSRFMYCFMLSYGYTNQHTVDRREEAPSRTSTWGYAEPTRPCPPGKNIFAIYRSLSVVWLGFRIRLRPHFTDVLKHHVEVSVERLDAP